MAKIEREFDQARTEAVTEPPVGFVEENARLEPRGENEVIRTLNTNEFAGIGLLRGDYLLVDTREAPQKGDTVIAKIEDRGMPLEVVRIFHPPFLYNPTVGAAEPEYVDHKHVTIVGVVRRIWRDYR